MLEKNHDLFDRVAKSWNHSWTLVHTLEHFLCTLKASYNHLDWFPEKSKFHVFLSFWVSWKNLFIKRDLSKTHRQTWRIHNWIPNGLRKVGKLLRSQTNS